MKIFLTTFYFFCICQLFIMPDSLGQNQASPNTNVIHNISSTDAAPVFTVPDPMGFVSDFEKLFSKSEIKTLDSMIMDFNKKSSIQMVVITIDTLMIEGNQMNEFTRQAFKSWGLQSTGDFNGILISLSRAYKNIRIETGSGVAQVLSDVDKKLIIQTAFIPSLADSKYYKATYDGLAAIINKLKL
ncbi:MAG: TPM domain-containing protein [Bacteroidota bacterium]|nr:TPM domain-containing protein [Bacteroidota bacterium]